MILVAGGLWCMAVAAIKWWRCFTKSPDNVTTPSMQMGPGSWHPAQSALWALLSVCATRSSMPRTCQLDLGPRADNISCTPRMRRNHHNITTFNNHQQIRVLIIVIMYFDLSAEFFGFSTLFWRWTNCQAASFTYIIISNGLDSKYCVSLMIRICLTRGEMCLLCHPRSLGSVWPVWPGQWQSESDINDSTFDELDFIKTRVEHLKRERYIIVLWFQCR